jgi:hypothetical protein
MKGGQVIENYGHPEPELRIESRKPYKLKMKQITPRGESESAIILQICNYPAMV